MSAPDWITGHPSNNKDFIGTMVVASLLIVSFCVGTGVMLYFWVKSWRGEDMHGKHISRGEKDADTIDLEAARVMPGDGGDKPPVVEAPKWQNETVIIGVESPNVSESSSARTSSDMPNNSLTPTRPCLRDRDCLHESYPNQ